MYSEHTSGQPPSYPLALPQSPFAPFTNPPGNTDLTYQNSLRVEGAADMSYYDNQQWPVAGRQPSWEQPALTQRSDTGTTIQREDAAAFLTQIEDIERAVDNIRKSSKIFGGFPARRDTSAFPASRPYPEYERIGVYPRHQSISEYDGMRSSSSSSLQSFYHSQRHSRQANDMDTMFQAKRRIAAQRERELRNYHQEQQYNRSVLADMSGAKSDRSTSPSMMTEEERRELIARQHRALYGNEASMYATNASSRPASQDARVAAGVLRDNGTSSLVYEQYQMGPQAGQTDQSQPQPMGSKDAGAASQQPRSRANSTTSPSSNPNNFSLFENAQQSSHTSNSSPGGSPPRQGSNIGAAGVAPIGTRPSQGQTLPGNAGNNKRPTPPLPSPLSYGYPSNDKSQANIINNGNASGSISNPPSAIPDKGVGLGWGGSNAVWAASKNPLGVPASVWG